ncbi:hypothetical protein MUP07_05140 [Candidatus Bathyarchaeota archaeon]|nr:hypothetical protein [Candidatus Bathyarchaeota archaeon]
MMKGANQGPKLSRAKKTGPSFEKSDHNLCPGCGTDGLTVYFESGHSRKVGALCYSCGLVGFFARNDFVQLRAVTRNLRDHKRIVRVTSG